jgi:hypothetical protein
MHTLTRTGLLFTIALAAIIPIKATPIFITSWTKNAKTQDLDPTLPTGIHADQGSGFGVQFNITANSDGFNYATLAPMSIFTVNVNINDVTKVYTLMNAAFPTNGAQLTQITFNADNAHSQSFFLTNNSNIRDYIRGSGNSQTIDGVVAKNFYTNGGNTRQFDEQAWLLDSGFLGHTLTTIQFVTFGNVPTFGTPFLVGITVDGTLSTLPDPTDTSTPEPATMAMGVGGAAVLWIGRKRFSKP